jgi:hypothetical protein
MSETWHYVYYSCEPWGRGYIGKRSSRTPPEQDPYMGSFTDSTFKPEQKIILAEFDSAEEALLAEIALHHFYEVDINPHFANKARQTSEKFYYVHTGNPHENLSAKELAIKNSRISMAMSSGARGFYYCLRSPSGLIVVTHNLRATCKEHNLNRANLGKVLKGQRSHSKGWTITRHNLP